MSPSQWGPPTWIFLHTLVAKIKDEQFPVIGQQVIANIIQICLFIFIIILEIKMIQIFPHKIYL